jgi:penicillin-binding protein 2
MRRYFIRRPKHLIEPEEILFDANRSELLGERIEFSIPSRFFRLLFVLGLTMIMAMTAYAGYLTTVRHEWYIQQADANRLRLLFIEAPRGKIYDRFGEILADNKDVFDVAALPLLIPKDEGELKAVAQKLSKIVGVSSQELLAKLQAARKSAYAQPLILLPNVESPVATLIEKAGDSLPGIKIIGRHIRVYPKGPAFSHVLGYTGKITKEELKRFSDAALGATIGRFGVEQAYDALLRGKNSREEIEVNAALEVVDMRRTSFAEPGQDLMLTIDAGFQETLYQIMTAYLAAYGYERAAAVALQPKTGEVLALISIPSFDNNRFAAGIGEKEYTALLRNPSRPLFNRALQGSYSPGSTVKPLIAVAALSEGIVTPDTKLDATKGYITIPNPYDPEKVSVFRDWRAHGWVDIRRAIAWSSNVFFYIVGGGYEGRQGLGITKINEWLKRFGLGVPTGIDLQGEASGLVPDPEWKAKNRPADPYWRLGDTYITSIGQGDLLVTPLQLAVAYAAIANGGKILEPYIVKGLRDRVERHQIEVAREHLEVVQDGMRLATAEGSARSLSILPFETAGKTGTVQVSSGKTNAVFAVYAPLEDPQILLVIIVENGGEGSSTAVPIAREALAWYWENRLKK